MRSPALAIAWELRQRQRAALVALANHALAGWPMLSGPAAMASLWLVTAPLGAVFLAWTQVLTWTAYAACPGCASW